ncbi:MAG: peptide-methionine (S)-S-oxide reductase MsrA [Candidatus Altimarinota bacterium]
MENSVKLEKAIFAAGCFWGVQQVFDMAKGVIRSAAGYTAGKTENPTYEQVCQGDTGHAEAVELEFDPEQISYERLLEIFFEMHDPTTLNRQGPDIGHQYRSGIYYLNAEQEKQAKAFREKIQQKNPDRQIVTEIVEAKTFYRAEEYHQKYFEKAGVVGCHYIPPSVYAKNKA